MPLLRKGTKEEFPQDRGNEFPEKEVNVASIYPDEKIASDADMTTSPTEDDTIRTSLPANRETESTHGSRHESSTQSTILSSNASSSNIGPDLNPVTRQARLADDGKEVVVDGVSQYSPSISTSFQPTRLYREYNFYYTNSLSHLVICDPDQQALYFAEMSAFAKSMPDVSLRNIATAGFDNLAAKGPSLGLKEAKDAPVVATADSIPSSKHIKLGLGDPLQPEMATWIVLRNVHDDPKSNSRKYDMVINGPGSRQTNYQWIQGVVTDNDSSDSPGQSSSRRNSNSKEAFRMVSENSLIASFRNAGLSSVKKRGALRVYETPDIGSMLLVVFLSCAALCEKQRRTKVKKAFLLG